MLAGAVPGAGAAWADPPLLRRTATARSSEGVDIATLRSKASPPARSKSASEGSESSYSYRCTSLDDCVVTALAAHEVMGKEGQ